MLYAATAATSCVTFVKISVRLANAHVSKKKAHAREKKEGKHKTRQIKQGKQQIVTTAAVIELSITPIILLLSAPNRGHHASSPFQLGAPQLSQPTPTS